MAFGHRLFVLLLAGSLIGQKSFCQTPAPPFPARASASAALAAASAVPVAASVSQVAASASHQVDASASTAAASAVPVVTSASPVAASKSPVAASASTSGPFAGITDTGKIAVSEDGSSWTVIDFNAVYAGYYPHTDFIDIASGGGCIAALGIISDPAPASVSPVSPVTGQPSEPAASDPTFLSATGQSSNQAAVVPVSSIASSVQPVVYYSTSGSVWSKRDMEYRTAGGGTSVLDKKPLSIHYDQAGDQMIIICEDGYVFFMPACSHCNSLQQLAPAAIQAILRSDN